MHRYPNCIEPNISTNIANLSFVRILGGGGGWRNVVSLVNIAFHYCSVFCSIVVDLFYIRVLTLPLRFHFLQNVFFTTYISLLKFRLNTMPLLCVSYIRIRQ